jgi:hypothetical protein
MVNQVPSKRKAGGQLAESLGIAKTDSEKLIDHVIRERKFPLALLLPIPCNLGNSLTPVTSNMSMNLPSQATAEVLISQDKTGAE